MSATKQSRFMRSMTPSGSIKMSTSRFNLVCGKTVEQAVRPNLDRIPNPQPPKIIDSRVLTPTLSRRNERGRSQTRDNYGRPPPVPPTRDASLYIPFGSYAERGIHARPGRYASTAPAPFSNPRRSMTPGPAVGLGSRPQSQSSSANYSSSSSRRNSVSMSSSSMMSSSVSRQRHYSASFGTPAASRGIPFY